ncbi:radical SAM protein [Flavobacterium salilacus subsp. salilacus]|uniref:B12-binding domain-containing radical SAM protein n=1 Tax=Flavobacterium TaxID=237 RepID=UPI001074F28A|nr:MULTISPECIES: radical SAM protein [Flavobacterium]KAF2519702.1 radical SAM protein [Flavobacterium salilacus subsp. salilacus]MBE1614409.1 radical SAM protein [Flavobacterium sp. SaA2.13]
MSAKLFLITPPFTQLNTPYPATAYLKGFLNTKCIATAQADLGIDVINKLFSKQGLTHLFTAIATNSPHLERGAEAEPLTPNSERIIALKEEYLKTIDSVMLFLQGKNPTLSHLICQEDFLPEASRFAQLDELDWAFGTMGTQDKAKHLATLYLEDISDLIVECVDPHFGFSRYAERLGRSANSFDELYESLQQPYTYIDELLIGLLHRRMEEEKPDLVCFSVPFPGNLYAAFRSAQYIKAHFPKVKIAMGGGFPNTELRSLSDSRVMEFFDFITLDDGEAPIECLVEYIEGRRELSQLKRTFVLQDNKVTYIDNSGKPDYKQAQVGTPDYAGLPLDSYISVIEIVNPMHRMWSDGRWNKLTMAHGCYWGKCTFCDISLDYIKIYEPVAAKLLVDRMEELVAQTGQNGFHFVDEAAPPALMREVALEIIRRKLAVTWWTNIRFEKSFTADLCRLLKASGCIAVSGGLEVASDRLLDLIQKGVTVAQVARVTRNFTEPGIMVHAYLMYGFPTQTAQETIDSLEMVRQMFETGILQSGFWHQFAMTAHSPVGLYPEKFNVVKESDSIGSFANNDIVHIDKTGAEHDKFSFGLKKSLFNYMHGICFDYPLQDWFDFKVPRTKIDPDYIYNVLQEDTEFTIKPTAKLVWLGGKPAVSRFTKTKKGRTYEVSSLTFHDKREVYTIQINQEQEQWLVSFLSDVAVKPLTFTQAKHSYETACSEDFELFWYSKPINTLRDFGLLVL